MEPAQASLIAPQAGSLALLSAALTLGLRHGIDWDHLVAIGDITSSARRLPRARQAGQMARPVWLASLYAIGHASVVILLGVAALTFRAVLPAWVDVVMERVVGLTLVALGGYVVYSLTRFWCEGGEVRLQSRWMLVFSGVRRLWHRVTARLHGHIHDGGFHVHRVDTYGPATAFGTGVVHGIGAETGTQVLLIAAIGGAASQGLGAGMLLAFVAGLLVANTAVAVLAAIGFFSASRARALYVAAGCLAAVLSLYVGSHALLGISDQLLDLQQVLGFAEHLT